MPRRIVSASNRTRGMKDTSSPFPVPHQRPVPVPDSVPFVGFPRVPGVLRRGPTLTAVVGGRPGFGYDRAVPDPQNDASPCAFRMARSRQYLWAPNTRRFRARTTRRIDRRVS
jgi:hypothetical protein